MSRPNATYMDRQAVARSVEILAEIRGKYEEIIVQFPKSDSLAYYHGHVSGLTEAIEVLESLRTP